MEFKLKFIASTVPLLGERKISNYHFQKSDVYFQVESDETCLFNFHKSNTKITKLLIY